MKKNMFSFITMDNFENMLHQIKDAGKIRSKDGQFQIDGHVLESIVARAMNCSNYGNFQYCFDLVNNSSHTSFSIKAKQSGNDIKLYEQVRMVHVVGGMKCDDDKEAKRIIKASIRQYLDRLARDFKNYHIENQYMIGFKKKKGVLQIYFEKEDFFNDKISNIKYSENGITFTCGKFTYRFLFNNHTLYIQNFFSQARKFCEYNLSTDKITYMNVMPQEKLDYRDAVIEDKFDFSSMDFEKVLRLPKINRDTTRKIYWQNDKNGKCIITASSMLKINALTEKEYQYLVNKEVISKNGFVQKPFAYSSIEDYYHDYA